MKNILVIALLVSSLFKEALGQNGSLRIHLVVTDSNLNNKIIGHTELYLLSDTREHRIIIDSNFDFLISNPEPHYKKIGIHNRFWKTDTCENGIVHQFFGFKDVRFRNLPRVIGNDKNQYFEIKYPPICEYDKSKCNNSCPNCKKSDQVIPIKYGLIVEDPLENNKIIEEYHAVGSDLYGNCNPNWHCKRDGTDF